MNKVSESIFSNKNIIIPLAEVMFIEKHFYGNPSEYGGIKIIFKGTRWDMEADTWSNNAYLSNHEGEDKKFLKAWCYYRHEIEGGKEAFKLPSDSPREEKK